MRSIVGQKTSKKCVFL